MVKIKAKQLISGKVTRVFFKLLLSFVIFSVGAAAVFSAFWGFDNSKVNAFFQGLFGEYSFYAKAALVILFCLLGLLLIAVGVKRSALAVCRTVSNNSFSGSTGKSFSFFLYLCVKTLFLICWGFVFLFPSAICASFLFMSLSRGALEKNVFLSWVLGSVALFIIGLAFLFVISQRYSAWKYYLCLEKYGVMTALYKSLEKTQGRCFSIAAFRLSMLGWLLSCLLVFPVIYVAPYYGVSSAYFILKGEPKKEKQQEERLPAVFEIIREN